MEDIGNCLVKWVSNNQLNINELKNKCENLSDLSDGIVFYELMNGV